MAMENFTYLTKVFMKESSKMVAFVVKENTLFSMVKFMRESGKMI